MKTFVAPLLLTAAVATAACQPLSPQDRSNLGLLGGAGAGLLTASAFDANPAWTVAATVAGAAIGTQVARNTQTGQCAYLQGYDNRGQPLYQVAPC
ncbi:glycine zipper 2TM domain-containing protein [Gymnodinialimonas sp. 2305UL16-5]|uniref:glycine zipper 2TM domain-containing protein n=1 Tax=Gymnodinialimonas mytili TaxID=3126503 RepID=UPI0030B0EFF6